MPYLDLHGDYDDLSDVPDYAETHRNNLDSAAIAAFVEDAKTEPTPGEPISKTFEFVTDDGSADGLQAPLRLAASVEQEASSFATINATIDDMPEDAHHAEALVRAVIEELRDDGCSQFEVFGSPGRSAGITCVLFP